jgi:hypothetical protein
MSSPQEVRMNIKGLMLDPSSNTPIVLLKEEAGISYLPIWIGVFEASAIQLSLEGVEPQRPMTHDLLAATLVTLGIRLSRIVISDLRDNTFFATLHLERGDEAWRVDSRPSDAMALALRAAAPIFVDSEVLEQAKAANLGQEIADEDRLRKWLEELDPDALGKYTM